MKLIIVRHSESEGNVSGLIQGGSLVINLTNNGRKQAGKLTEKLRELKIDLAFVSPIDRVRQTAEIVLEKHPNTKIEFSDKLKEKNPGVFAGRPTKEMGDAWQTSGLPFGEFQPEGGESWYQAGERVVGFGEKIMNQYKDTDITVLLVGHGSIFTYLLMWADKFDPQKNTKEKYDYYHPDNTAMAIIEVNHKGESALVSLNDTSHLN